MPSFYLELSMPTYEYVCTKCNHKFELIQSIRDHALTVCPQEHCGQKKWGKGKVTRLIGAGAGLIFKGSGFYITDYRSKEYKEAAKKEAPSSAPASPAPSADSKPAKSEATPKKSETKGE
jgi:putative FmdB family regulatory protein